VLDELPVLLDFQGVAMQGTGSVILWCQFIEKV